MTLSKKLLLGLLPVLLLCLLFTACGGKETPVDTADSSSATEETPETVIETAAVSDTVGTTTETESEVTTTVDSATEPETDPPSAPETECQTEGETTGETETEPKSETETEVETHEIYEEVVGNVRVQLYSPSALRIEQAVLGAFCDKNTIAVTNRSNWAGVQVTRTVENGTIRLITDTYTVSIPEGATSAKDVKVTAPDGDSLWNTRLSSTAIATLPEPAKTRRYWAFNDCPRVTVPENGFTEVYADTENNGFTIEQDVADYYILICEENPFTLRSDYNRLVGACDMVTVKALGLWFSRFYAYKDVELLRLVSDYRRRGYPIDYVVCDTDWRVGSSTGYDINTQYFPDMEDFLSQMHEKNIQIAFNDHVRDNNNSLLSAEQLTWFNQNLTNILELGLDTWWYDRNWHYTLKSPFAEINQDMLGQMMYQSIMDAHNAPLNKRTVMLSNYYTDVHSRLTLPAYIGTHRYSVQWSGDITPAVLPNELENMVMLGALTSTAYISSDIGGHFDSPTNGMFVRWTQYGALSPIMRYHSSSADRSPWKYGEVADEVANTYINMRYRLMPVFYTLAHENYADGLPMARRLDFYYPQYEESRLNNQYLLGEDILVAPIADGEQPADPSWLKTSDGKLGVEISYYNNKTLSGNPVRTEHATNVDFNWGVGSPASGVGTDNFSAIVRASITPETDIYLGTISDDGVRVYVNDQIVINHWQASDSTMITNSNFILKANTAYDLRVEYYEEAGGASLRLLCIPTATESVSSRTVFIPDGKWMDVFSGAVYEGPKTIEVTHSIRTSPLFVRLGSLTALAHKSDYADTAQWERLVLDVYPAEGTLDTTPLYEDDGASLDYQVGKYRETILSTETTDGKTTVSISAAKGAYTTDWTEREWTVRLHATDVTSVTINGQSVPFKTVARDAAAAPFAAEGGSPDGDVVIVTFTAPINQATTIVVE